MNNSPKTLVVIGGGAAGIFCAANAARLDPSAKIIVLEKTGKLLSKVMVSGGGRCNVTHAGHEITEMVKCYPRGGHFVKRAFHRFFTNDTIDWFAARGVELKTEPDGRMFPVTDSSQTIIDCLMKEINKYGVEIRMKAEVVRVEVMGAAGVRADAVSEGETGDVTAQVAVGRFRVHLTDDRMLEADAICIACGGYPKGGMFGWMQGLGHTIEEPSPSLFTFNMPGHAITKLMGVTIPDVRVKIAGSGAGAAGTAGRASTKTFDERGPLLITHWGLSGPVILRLSAWGARELAASAYQFQILVNWTPEYTEQGLRQRLGEIRYEWAAQKVGSKNPFGLPQRLWEYFLTVCGIGDALRWADLPVREQNKLIRELSAGEFAVAGKTTFKEEFVTAGGVRLAEVDPATMQSRKAAGLFFAGEVLDVDGITGGYNFQHAWTSGWIAAQGMAG